MRRILKITLTSLKTVKIHEMHHYAKASPQPGFRIRRSDIDRIRIQPLRTNRIRIPDQDTSVLKIFHLLYNDF